MRYLAQSRGTHVCRDRPCDLAEERNFELNSFFSFRNRSERREQELKFFRSSKANESVLDPIASGINLSIHCRTMPVGR